MLNAESTLPKCEHGIYLCHGSSDGKALYCRLCLPDAPPDQREVVLPRSSASPLSTEGKIMANRRSGNGCPACGSSVWMRSKENGGDANRLCADCGAAYKIRLNTHQQAEQVRTEVEAPECLV
jgi:DNA-directed RNA polymerase subunit RPC12/RpoP